MSPIKGVGILHGQLFNIGCLNKKGRENGVNALSVERSRAAR